MKRHVTKGWIEDVVQHPDEHPSHLLVMQMLRNEMPKTVGEMQAMDVIGQAWYLLGRAWDNLCDAKKYEYSPYYILHAWEDIKEVLKILKSVGYTERMMQFKITKDGFDDKVADKVKELCHVVLGYVYEWEAE